MVALLGAALAACDAPNTEPFAIHFRLDTGAGGYCQRGSSCMNYGMSCGARLSVRIFDMARGPSGRGTPVGETCETLSRKDTVCELDSARKPVSVNVPRNTVRIEVAVWAPAELPDEKCPLVTFDERGRPRVDFQPRPAMAGSIYFDAASDLNDVWVPMQCSDQDQLDREVCAAPATTRVSARVDDMRRGFAVSDAQAAELNVSAAPPTLIPDSPGPQYRIDGDDIIDLHRVIDGPPPPTFETMVEGTVSENLCTVVVDSGPQVTATATCGDLATTAPDDLYGILVTTDALRPLLDAMGSEFPEAGLVVGRVLDFTGMPLAGVTVSPVAGTVGTVEYLDEAGTGLTSTTTSSRGYFISRDAPFGTSWGATHNDGREEQARQFGGLVQGMVSPVIVRMTEDAP